MVAYSTFSIRGNGKMIMKIVKLSRYLALLAVPLLLSPSVYAATNPPLGVAGSFSILAGTYTNTAAGTTINGDVGYTTGPATVPTINGTTHVADATYTQAGIDQGTALSTLNSQPCTFTFAPGAIDLATDTTHGPIGFYTPGVYCITGAASVGAAGITLTGSGTYIFRMDGALTTAANSVLTLSEGASACDIWWTPTAATTLGANSTFLGTDIDASGITIGSTVTWTGRALAFGGTVSTDVTTINTVPACSAAPPPPPPPSGDGEGATTPGANTPTATLANTGLAVKPLSVLASGILLAAIVTKFWARTRRTGRS